MTRYLCSFVAGLLFIGLAFATGYPNDASYTYDQLNRLVAIEYSDGTRIEYTYDDLGNRVPQNIFTSSDPVANFTLSPTAGVAPLSVTFTDQSSGIASSWSWSFGDGGGSTSQNPVYTYNNAGTYTVLLTVSNGVSSSSQSKTITVRPGIPVANFIASPTSGTAPLAVTFTDSSTGIVTGWSWSFGDGGTSSIQNPSHTYTNPGTYAVSLTAIGPGGNSNPQTTSITVVAPPPPVANFSGSPTSGNIPLTVQFTDASTGLVTSWSWSFGDGGTSTVQNPSHTYTNPGTYTVTLTVSGLGGNSNPATTSITVVPPPPVAKFSAAPTSGTAPLTVQFTDASTGSVTSWSWDFGDGTTSTSQNPNHTYSTPGTYAVSDTATGPGGSNTNTQTSLITVTPAPIPGIDRYTKLLLHGEGPNGGTTITDSSVYGYTPTSPAGVVTSTAQEKFGAASLSFNGSSQISYPSSTDWYIAGGHDFTIDAWIYNTNGSHSGICGTLIPADNSQWGFAIENNFLGFYGAKGWIAVSSSTFPLNQWTHVAAVRYQGTISIYINGVQSGTTSTATLSDSSSPSLIVGDMYPSSSYGWAFQGYIDEFRFSNGIARWTSNFTPPASEYGTSPPVANFSASPTSGTAPFTVQFSDTSSGTVTSWSWDFGDGTKNTSQNPNHTYTTAGTYAVSLIATGPNGSNTDTQANLITVSAPPPSTPGIDQYTKLLLHGEGANGGSTITDSSVYAHAPSAASGVVTSTAQKEFGAASLSLNGSSQVSYPNSTDWYVAGGQDFTIDAWVYYTGGSQNGICGTLIPGDNSQWGFAIQSNYLKFMGARAWIAVSSVKVPLNQWTHVAIVRYQGTIKLYINGSQSGTTSNATLSDSSSPSLIVGDMYPASSYGWAFQGYIDEFRFSNGIARWTSNFTPPNTAYGISAPGANFAASVINGNAPLTVQFTDTSTGTVTSRSWDFGDGQTSTSQNPNHTYSTPGTYTISLSVTGPEGSDTNTQTNYINVASGSPDQYTKLLLHGEGPNDSTTITDSSVNAHTPSAVAGAFTSTAQKVFGAASLFFNGYGYVRYPASTDWYLAGGQDFTIDAWVYNTNGSQCGICGTLTTANTQLGLSIHSNYLSLYAGGAWVAVSSSPIPLNQWTHVAVVRYQGTIKLYINGVQSGTTSTNSFSDTSSPYFIVGDMYPNNTGPWAFKGYIDEFRLSNGIARWTSNFTPPNSPYY